MPEEIKIKDLPLASTANPTDDIIIEDGTTTRRIHVGTFANSLMIQGPAGNTSYLHIKYSNSPNGNPMMDTPAKYIGTYVDFSSVASINAADYTWSQFMGDTGAQGLPGPAGTSSYTHIAYANSDDGETDFSVSDSNRTYVGMYVDENPMDSNDPADYKWTLIKGADGDQGIPGAPGEDGRTPYFHVAYATSEDGTEGFSTVDSVGKTYLGQYTDYEIDDSQDPTMYRWTKIKGEPGEPGAMGPEGPQGIQGPPGESGKTTYFHVKYSQNSTGDPMSETPSLYIGTYVDFEEMDSENYQDYTWTRFQGYPGDQGIPGENGADGKTSYLHIAYANSPDGLVDFSVDDSTDRDYMGQYVDFEIQDSENPEDYTWIKVKGEQGIPGPSGKSSYFHIKYSSVANPTSSSQLTETPDKYIGTYVDYEENDSEDPNMYTWFQFQGDPGDTGIPGTNGIDGKTSYLHIAYSNSADGATDFSTSDSEGKAYIGQYVDFEEEDSQTPGDYKWSKFEGPIGPQGEQGIQGPSGSDGKTSYFHVKYSDNPNGNPMSESPGKYIGTYVDFESSDSDNYLDYTWSQFTGDPGDQGIPGVNGENGLTSYLHIAYSDSPDGSVNFSTSDSTNRSYLGQYVDFEEEDSQTPSKYSWTKVKGEQGPQGIQGPAGENGLTSYFHIKYSDNASGNPMTEVPSKYIGTYVDFNSVDSNNYLDYTWSQFAGDPGAQGIPGTNGADGKTSYLHIAYANSANGETDFSTTDSEDKLYIGQYVDFTQLDSEDPSSYTWTRVQGPVGPQGEQGIPGPTGAAGADGVSSYFHIKFSDSPDGNPLSETPGKYIGTYVDHTKEDSVDPNDYTWSQFKGDPGDQGIPGTNGEDGKTSYLHIAYATSADGSTGFSTSVSSGKTYIGQYVDFTISDSQDPSKYKWTKVEGPQGKDGKDGTSVRILGSLDSTSLLPSGGEMGDGYLIGGDLHVWNGSEWTNVGTIQGPAGPQGESGADGQTSYLHIAYANSSDGHTDFSVDDSYNKQYIGQYVDFTLADSDNPDDYKWTKILGPIGPQGEQGIQGPAGKDGQTTYFHVKYSENANGSPMTENPSKYIGTYSDFTQADSTDPNDYTWSQFQGDPGDKGIPGENGIDGKTSYLHIAYATSADGSEGFSTSVSSGKTYIGQYVDFEEDDSQSPSSYKWTKVEGPIGPMGPQGEQGIQGPAGENGQTSYFHIKYSNNASGNPMTETPSKYIGTYVDFKVDDSDNYADYTWSQFVGDPGEQGIPGENGADGRTSYLHIAYATSADGSSGFSTSDSTDKTYIGQYVDFEQNDSTDPAKYSWTKIQGPIGPQGTQGIQGPTGAAGADGQTSYFHVKYSANSNGNPMSEDPNTYIGTYVDFTQADSDDPSDYKWSRFQGYQGDQGIPGENGENGQTSYLHIAYSNSADGSVDFSMTDSTDRAYIGTYVDFNEDDSPTYSDYTWMKVQGPQGIQGLQGLQGEKGDQGIPGKDGTSSYTHIAYADSADGQTNFSVSDPDREYIGMYVDSSPTDSQDPSLYAWSKIRGADGAQGIPGAAGADGRTPYLHIAYANSSDGSSGFSTTDSANKSYIGQYTDYNPADSTTPSDYSWTKIKGETGETGVGVKSITNYYLATASSSGVTSSTGGWTTNVQNVSSSQKYLWNYEIVTYTDNSTYTTTPCIIGTYGDKGATGATGNGIRSITEYYALSTSNSTAPSSWSTSVPTLTATNKYLWNYERITYTDGSTVDTTKRVIGVYGDKGATGDKGEPGKDGRGVQSTAVTYQASSSGTTIPTGTWTSTIPSVSSGQYLWTRTIISYTDGTSTTMYSVGKMGSTGSAGKGISSITEYYLATASSSGVTTSTSGWTTTIQSVSSSKKYLWNYEIIKYTDGSSTTISPHIVGAYGDTGSTGPMGPQGEQGIQGPAGSNGQTTYFHIKYSENSNGNPMTETPSKYIGTYTDFTAADSSDYTKYTWSQFMGDPGEQGIPGAAGADGRTSYLHMAYATSADGSTGFSTTDSANKTYIGQYVDFEANDSTDPAKYSWTLIKGATGATGAAGNGISSITNYYLATSASSGVTTETSGWTTSVQSLTTTNKYLWNYEVISYTNGSTASTTPHVVGVYGNTGPAGADGSDGEDGKMLYATSSTAGATAAKVATLKSGSITLTAGVTVAVKFTYANTAASPTLNVGSTGAKAIYTQGVRYAYWSANQTVVFTYDGSYWRVASEPVYANTVTVGNTNGRNVYIDSSSIDLRNGSSVMASFESDKITMGNLLEITETGLQIGYHGDFEFTGEEGYLDIKANPAPGIFFTPASTGESAAQMWFTGSGPHLSQGAKKSFGGDWYALLTHNDIKLSTSSVRLGPIGIACGTVVGNANGTSLSIISLSSINSLFGATGSSADNTAVFCVNGDANTSSVHVEGASLQGSNWYAVFDRAQTGLIRINYVVVRWGLPVNPE